MSKQELETRCFLEEAKNISIEIKTSAVELKQYIIGFNKTKDYKTSNEKLIIGNGKFDILNIIINWIKVIIIKDKMVIPFYDGNIVIEEF